MITATFRHISGIGPLRERQLWLGGVREWAAVPAEGDVLSPKLDAKLREGVALSQERLEQGDVDWFARKLPQTEHWRLYPHVARKAAYLDIEAAGEKVTVIGVLDAHGVASLQAEEFLERSREWSALVTFNGAAFDVPILRRVFPQWQPPAVHVDLKHVYQRLREKGGLKELEVRVGYLRPPHLGHLNGADAIALWHDREQPHAWRRLVEYNLYDVFVLKPLAERGYNRLVEKTRMPAPPLEVSDRGAMLYDVSCAVERACE
jgi:uncharacterized protein YprB with RNaseH-like and TPR domain